MKKGELSINVIVVAAIGMLILVIISVLVFRGTGGLVDQTSCTGLGANINAECVASNADCRAQNGVVNSGAICPGNDVCCVLPTTN